MEPGGESQILAALKSYQEEARNHRERLATSMENVEKRVQRVEASGKKLTKQDVTIQIVIIAGAMLIMALCLLIEAIGKGNETTNNVLMGSLFFLTGKATNHFARVIPQKGDGANEQQ